MAYFDDMTEQEIRQNKAIRGYIVRALAKGNQNSLLVRQITNALLADNLITVPDISKQLSYGKGYRPRGYGKGNYKASGKMSMLRDDYDDVLAYCKAKGIPFYGIEWPSVVVSYANEGERTRIDELKKVIPTKRSHKAAQGDKSLTVDIDLMIVGGIVEDGVEPTK